MFLLFALPIAGLFFLLFQRCFPIQDKAYKTDKTHTALIQQYRRFDLSQLLLFFGLTVLCFCALAGLVYACHLMKTNLIRDATFIVHPSIYGWFVAVFFGALYCAAVLSLYIAKRRLQNNWEEYLAYSNLKYRFNAIKLHRPVLIGMGTLSALVLGILFNNYSAFYEDKMVANPIFGITIQTHTYDEIAALTIVQSFVAPNGQRKHRPSLYLAFKNGEEWISRNQGFQNWEDNLKLADFLSIQSQMDIGYKDLLPD